ncbi:hypothetical protein [Peribacillus acanthi]|uniref:hypothetical protein n=1 Tax=Peribacillus acanthi TaxID=2171554 RepID=UPI000D3E9D39|nr:hypothetical protein [Peribacillus acanthi]
MRTVCYFGLVISVFLIFTSNAIASSWVQLEPEVVVERADVVVIGTYDFSSRPEKDDMILHGYEFNVQEVFLGEVTNPVTVGIDFYDVAWAKEFQKKGGLFLLFLEKAKGIDYLVPVGGPNGMVNIFNGKVKEGIAKSNSFYEKYLQGNDSKSVNVSSNKSAIYWFGSLLVVVGLLVIFLIFRRKK